MRPTNKSTGLGAWEASARFAGTFLLIAIAFLHVLDISHKIDEGVWYMAALFAGLIAAAVALAVGLVKLSSADVTGVWIASGLLALGALGGYAVSRLVPLPGMADHQGDWVNTYGVLAGVAEIALIALSAMAVRELSAATSSREDDRFGERLTRARGVGGRSGVFPAILITAALAASLATPAPDANAHGGVDDEPPLSSSAVPDRGGPEKRPKKVEPEATTEKAMVAAGHGDPFLGPNRLAATGFGGLLFLGWAAVSLHGSVLRGREPVG